LPIGKTIDTQDVPNVLSIEVGCKSIFDAVARRQDRLFEERLATGR
jgi:hypothetical protein